MMEDSFEALSEAMDVDATMDADHDGARYLVVDTNVLISALDILVSVAKVIEERNLRLEFLVPGIIIEELDGLKLKTGHTDRLTGHDVGLSARRASDFLLDHLRRRHRTGKGCVRGQSYRETLQPGQSWKRRVNNESNDELILDCALFFVARRPVTIITMDRNFSVMSLAQNLPTVVFERKMNAVQLLSQCVPELQDSIYASRHASDRVLRQASAPPKQFNDPTPLPATSRHAVTNSAGDTMMVDEEQAPTNILDAAHTQLCQMAAPLVRAAAQDVVDRERERLQRGGSDASIHSRSRNQGFSYVKDLPSANTLQSADLKLCLNLCWRLTKAERPWSTLVGFLIPFGERGARRGRDYTRGDWVANAEELVRLGEAVDFDDITKLGREVQAYFAVS